MSQRRLHEKVTPSSLRLDTLTIGIGKELQRGTPDLEQLKYIDLVLVLVRVKYTLFDQLRTLLTSSETLCEGLSVGMHTVTSSAQKKDQ